MLWRIKYNRMKSSSAELAYFTLLSLFPFFIILLNVFSRISLIHSNVISDILMVFPNEIRSLVQTVIADLQMGFGSTVQLVVTILGAVYSAGLGIKSMIISCNLAFEKNEQKKGISLTVTGLMFTVAFVVLIILFFVTGILGDTIFNFLSDFFKFPSAAEKVRYYVENIVTPIYMVLIIFLLNRYSVTKNVRKKLGFRGSIAGAAVSAGLMIVLSTLFSLRISNTDSYAITYGSISSVIMLIIWLYLMGSCLVLGFEINGALYEIKNYSQKAKEKSFFREITQNTRK